MGLFKPRAALLIGLVVLSSVAFQLVTAARVGPQRDKSYILPNGQQITPAGTHIEVADRPLGLALSPDGRLLAVVTGSNFAPPRIHLIDVNAPAIVQSIGIGDSFLGIAFSSDGGQLYVGGGRDSDVKVYQRQAVGGFAATGSISIANSEPSGLSLDPSGSTIYVALNLKHSVAIVDVRTGTFKEVPVGIYPYTTVVTRDGAKVYVSNWGGRRVRTGDTTDGFQPVVVDPQTGIASTGTISVLDPMRQTVVNNIDVGLHPSGMALSPNGLRLYVANTNSDTVSVIRTLDDSVEKTIDVRLFAEAPLGSAPDALAVSPDGKRLYVANAANNAVAVVEPDNPDNPVRGFIPTGWFPTAVALSPSGNTLYVASGYGFGSVANQGIVGRSFRDRTGVISILAVPDDAALAVYTRQVLSNNSSRQVGGRAITRRLHPVSKGSFDPSPIKHVFYIIKENRTYDQVFGDLAQGNGQPSLVQFGRNVTPNHHALAEQFVLLDNFYAAGDQSALGHQWCDEAYANDYVHKYGNARNDSAGTNPMAYAPTGFLWDHVRNRGMTVRMYGEFTGSNVTPSSSTWTDVYNAWKNATGSVSIQSNTRVAGVRDILAPRYAAFDMRVPDQLRVEEFLAEFHQFEQSGNQPNLVIMLLPADHTNGTTPGYPTPRAMVADNDLALGRIVEAISKSRYWPETAIFVTEDDAQDGADHVDGHRTVGLVVSPYVRRGTVDSNLWTTINMFRTIEQIFGLSPLNQFDLRAAPMFSSFTQVPDLSVYTALPNQIPLDEMNPPIAGLQGLQRRLALASMRMDFSRPDAAPEDLLNRAIWHSVKGYKTPYPSRDEGKERRSGR